MSGIEGTTGPNKNTFHSRLSSWCEDEGHIHASTPLLGRYLLLGLSACLTCIKLSWALWFFNPLHDWRNIATQLDVRRFLDTKKGALEFKQLEFGIVIHKHQWRRNYAENIPRVIL